MKKILLANKKLKGNATAQIAHLVFCRHTKRANPKKTKRAIFLPTLGQKQVSLRIESRN
jgi:hypothetical protein